MTLKTRKRMGRVAAILTATAFALPFSGCGTEEFRNATASSFETGLTSLATGLITGLMAVYTPGEGGGSSS
jgi:hypothetical protein